MVSSFVYWLSWNIQTLPATRAAAEASVLALRCRRTWLPLALGSVQQSTKAMYEADWGAEPAGWAVWVVRAQFRSVPVTSTMAQLVGGKLAPSQLSGNWVYEVPNWLLARAISVKRLEPTTHPPLLQEPSVAWMLLTVKLMVRMLVPPVTLTWKGIPTGPLISPTSRAGYSAVGVTMVMFPSLEVSVAVKPVGRAKFSLLTIRTKRLIVSPVSRYSSESQPPVGVSTLETQTATAQATIELVEL